MPVRGESMEFAVTTRRKSPAPPTDDRRHPFREGDAPAPFGVPAKRVTLATAQTQSGTPQWRPSVRPMQPVSADAAGMTDARRAAIAARATFAPRADCAPRGRDALPETAPSSPRAAPSAPTRLDGGGEDGGGGCGVSEPPAGAETALRSPKGDDGNARSARGFGPDETGARHFGRAPSPRRRRPGWQHESHFSFADEGTRERSAGDDSHDARRARAAARNLERTASLDARAQAEDRFRTLKARGPEYAWERRGAAAADPNALWGGDAGAERNASGRGGRAIGPRRDLASLEAEREARVVGVRWGSAPVAANGTRRLGSPATPKNDAWGVHPESVGAIQFGVGMYREYPGAGPEEAPGRAREAGRFLDPRASERAAHEKALYASTAARFDDAALEELAANRARCEAGGTGRVLGHFLYEARGEEEIAAKEAAAEREGLARARLPSPKKRADPERTDTFGASGGERSLRA